MLVGTSDQDPTALTPLSSARSSRPRSDRASGFQPTKPA